MAKRSTRAKPSKPPAPKMVSSNPNDPTPEQFARGTFEQGGNLAVGKERDGLAYRRVPVIDTMRRTGQLTDSEHASLAYYRNQAIRAEDDVAVEGTLAPSKIMGGGGSSQQAGYIPASLIWTPAIMETARIERDMGALWNIARAVAVDDVSLSQWCVSKFGGRERYDGTGKLVAIVPVRERECVKIALMELKHAARRIAA